MVRACKALGGGSSILPYNVDYAEEMPWDLTQAISHALMILGWQENLMNEELPPRWMWHHDDELNKWFEEVRENRENKYSSSGSSTQAPRGDYSDPNKFMKNELADEMRSRK